MFALSEWTPISPLRKPSLKSAPIWVTLKNIPPKMFSLQGISYIASGIGEPLHTDKMRLDPLHVGTTRIKVEIQLGSTLPSIVEIEDDTGEVTGVKIDCEWLPPRCPDCNEFGHNKQHCPSRNLNLAPKTQAGSSEQEAEQTKTQTIPQESAPPKISSGPPQKAISTPPPLRPAASPPSQKPLILFYNSNPS
ncbi:PREDICTED: uncharacterized protein LOC104827688 [Tarenaya hassleriana]|uniref:uncharacterized protein LOC104827688 n=1 Tax=Tarenaya hassleriana TaxID=28532 RepID=UPI00053C1862|nr:PREDICTED: uncharacterized protein LOC104827688 [Tarenaya hassleriana]